MTPQALGAESVEPLGNADQVYPATGEGQFAQQPVGAGSEQRGHTYGAAGDSAVGTGVQKTAHQEGHVHTAECVDVSVGAPRHVRPVFAQCQLSSHLLASACVRARHSAVSVAIADVSAGSCLQVDARHEFDSSPGAQIDADVTSVKTTTTAKSPAVQVRL